MPPRGLLLLLAGFVLLSAAWLFSTPPGSAPDEHAQYLRALGISEGQLLGPREPLTPSAVANLADGGSPAAEQTWIDHDRRGVVVPAALSPPGAACIGRRDTSGRCIEVSYTGDYYPVGYLLPAVGVSAAHTWQTALFLARVGSLVQVLMFLVLALILTGPGSGWRLVGLLAATTPMVLFIGSMMNPDGLEIAANLAFFAGLLRLRLDPAGFPRWAWASLVVSGAVTVLAWQLGPWFVAVDIAVWAALMGADGLRALYTIRRRHVLGAGAVMVGATVLFVAYGRAAGVLHSSVTFASPLSALHGGLRQLGPALIGAVGDFGAQNVPLPGSMIRGWWVAVIALVAVGVWLGKRPERRVLVVAAALGLAFPVVFFAFSYRLSGFGLEGRYVLPILAITPMLAGDVIESARGRLDEVGVAGLWRAGLVAFALFQLGAWWVNAHHYARLGLLGAGTLWSPPLGWRFWLVVALLGAAAIAIAAASARPAAARGRQSGDRIGSIKLRSG